MIKTKFIFFLVSIFIFSQFTKADAEAKSRVKSETKPETRTESASEKKIVIRSDPWCPFACESENTNKPGILVEIAQKIFQKHGYKIDYQNTNFARAISETRAGNIDAVVGCAKEDAPDFVFPTKSIVDTVYQYYKLANNPFAFTDFKNLSNVKLGAINGYAYDKETTKEINSKNKHFIIVSGDDGLNQLIKMLDANRVDAFIESKEVFKYYISYKKINLKKYKLAGEPKQTPQEISICFSPKNQNSKMYAKWIHEGMIEMKNNNEYSKIVKKYIPQ